MKAKMILAAIGLIAAISAAHGQMEKTAVSGVVVKLDPSAGKITLKHDEIPNMNMEAMTMVFAVKDPAMLSGLKVGDKVRFEAAEVSGLKTVVGIQQAK